MSSGGVDDGGEDFSNWDDGDDGAGEGGEGGHMDGGEEGGDGGDGDGDSEGFDPAEGVYTESGAFADDGSGDSLYDGEEGADQSYDADGAGDNDEGDEGAQPGEGGDGAGAEGDEGVDPVQEAKMAALEAARQKALNKIRVGMGAAAAPAASKPSFVSRAAAAAAAAAPSAAAAAAAPSLEAPKGKSARDRRKEAKEAKAAAQRMPVAAAAASSGSLSAKEQAKLDRAARFASTNASAAAAALAPPSHSAFSAGRSPSHSPSPSPDFGAPPAFIGGRGAPRSTASLMAQAMGGAADDSGGAGGAGGDEEVYSAEHYAPIVGQCMLMCPLEEQQARQESRDLSYFEIQPGTGSKEHGDVPLVDPAKAVKKYKRAAAAQTLHAKDVRPPAVLRQTMDYLVRCIMDRHDSPDPPPLPSFLVIYRFVSDRMRALRQDFACQGRRDALAVGCYETMVRFHVLTMFELGDVANIEKFDPTPNMEKLSQTLTSLRHMFHDNYTNPTGAPFPTPNEAEMHSYRLLIDLDRRFATLYEELDKFDPAVKASPIVQFCVQVYNAYRENNYARFFSLARAAPYCHAVLLGLHFNRVRARALEVMSHAYKSYPFGELVEGLAFENDKHARDFLAFHGVETDPTAQTVVFKTRGHGSFQHPERGATPFPQRNSWKIVGLKRPPKVSQAALGAVGRGEGLGLERFLPPSATASFASSASSAAAAASSSSLVRSRAMVLPRAQPLPLPSAVALPSFGGLAPASGSFASAFGQQQQTASSAFGLPVAQPMPQSTSSAFGGNASGRPVFGGGASTVSAFGGGGGAATGATSAFEMPAPGSLDGVVSKPTKFNRGAVSSDAASAAAPQLAPAALTALNPKAAPFVPTSSGKPAAAAAAALSSVTPSFGGVSAFGSGQGPSAPTSATGFGGGAFGSSTGTVGFGGFSTAFGNNKPAAATTGPAAIGSAFGAVPAPVVSAFGSGTSPAPVAAVATPAAAPVSAFGRGHAAPAPASSGFVAPPLPAKPSAAPAAAAAAPAFPVSFAATVAASASRTGAAAVSVPSPSPPAIVPGQTAHISGFQLPVVAPRTAPSTASTTAPPAAAAAVPPPHPRPPLSIQRASATASAAAAAAASAAAPVAMVDAAPAKPRKPVPTPAQTQEMFLSSLRCYRHSLLRRGLRSWHQESAERARVRAAAAAAQAVLERRADTFAATKWFLHWHASMVQHQQAQRRFLQAQAALHAPVSMHLAAKLPFQTRGAAAQRSLAGPSSTSGALVPSSGGAFVGANGVTSGLISPLAKLQRMGIARGEMVLSGEEPFDVQDEYADHEQQQEEEQQHEEERRSGQLNFDEADQEEQEDEWQYEDAGDEYAEGEGEGAYAEGEDGAEYGEEGGEQGEYAEETAYDEGEGEAEQYDDGQQAEQDDGGVAPMDQAEDEEQPFAAQTAPIQQARDRAAAPSSAASKVSRGPFSPAARSPLVKAAPRVSLHFTSPLTPLRHGGAGATNSGGSSAMGSHKRSRQSIEVDQFLAQFVSPSRRRAGGPSSTARTPAAPAPTPAQQPAAVFDSDGNHAALYDESDGEEEHIGVGASAGGGRRSGARLKLFHTPSHATPRAVFASPADTAAASAGYARSAFDVSAALEAASSYSPSTYLKPRSAYASHASSPAVSLAAVSASAAAAARPRDLVQQVQSELRQSSKLDELMQQLEFRYGSQL